MSDEDDLFDAAAIIASGECISCGECVPWNCPNCKEQRCNWFENPCRDCGAKPQRKDYDTRRVRRDLAELEGLLERSD